MFCFAFMHSNSFCQWHWLAYWVLLERWPPTEIRLVKIFFFPLTHHFAYVESILCRVSQNFLCKKMKIFIHMVTILNILLIFIFWIIYLLIQLIKVFRNNISLCWTILTFIYWNRKKCRHLALYYRNIQYIPYIWSSKNLFQIYLNSMV